ncbi:MAG: hydrogenase formation protein HypD [Bacteroidia bacterium]|nr:hydrogenase formation protein HypD [Bacteroidia bacterium]
MKYLTEYRNPEIVQQYLDELHRIVTRPWTIMEICGGQTHSLVKNGILDLLPQQVTMVHGPGCPVCVTPAKAIDEAIALAENDGVVLCSFGDMLRVPGSEKSLLEAKARGANISMLYSPLEAVKLAKENPLQEFVFFAVGFETTAPANALSVIQAHQLGLTNYSILASHVLVPPAMETILSDPDHTVDAFLAAGHVCTIMGIEEYIPVVEKYHVPIVVTGFEPVDLLQGILMAVRQLEKGETKLENPYTRVVRREGNIRAKQQIRQVFEVSDQFWRGIGSIPRSGHKVKSAYSRYDARKKFNLNLSSSGQENKECIAGDILKGVKKPPQCPHFRKKCTPEHPLGAPMVSSEGACSAYFQYNPST